MAATRPNTYRIEGRNNESQTVKADDYVKKEDYFYFTDTGNNDVLTIHTDRVRQIELVTDNK